MEKKGTPEGFKTIIYQDSDILNARLLAQGRIDCFLADEVPGLVAIKTTDNDSKIGYDKNKPLISIPLFFAFQSTEKAKADKFSEIIKQMKADGSLQKILTQ